MVSVAHTVELPATRAEAIEAGSVRYFTGEPCKYGHVSPRYALNGACVACMEERIARERKRAAEVRAKRANAGG